jgi:alcohol dehydrogenase class IV
MALITYLTKIQFDYGALGLLSEELAGLGIQRPMIVTDPGLAASGILDRVQGALNGTAATVYDQTPANPTEPAVREALALYRSEGCDGLIGVGGGSSIDLAKGVRLLATHDGPLALYAMSEGGVGRIRPDIAKLIAIPTTAGTGSEVGRGAVVIMDDGRKLGVVSPHLIPNVAICDPDLTLSLPPGLTAGTGMDAIAHCVETYLSNAINPPAEGIALDGLRRASQHIRRATQDGQDREARWNMMMAAMEGAMAFQKGLGAVHAMSHPHPQRRGHAGSPAFQPGSRRRQIQCRRRHHGPGGRPRPTRRHHRPQRRPRPPRQPPRHGRHRSPAPPPGRASQRRPHQPHQPAAGGSGGLPGAVRGGDGVVWGQAFMARSRPDCSEDG